MQTKKIMPLTNGISGAVQIPGDKSISHRAVMLAALGNFPVTVKNFLRGADCLSTVECLRALGAHIDEGGVSELTITGRGLNGLTEPATILNAGNSGTTLRLLLGLLAPRKMFAAFCGDASLTKRPMARVIIPLTQMGAKIVGCANNKFLPIAVMPSEQNLAGITYDSPVASAQVKSAILLAGLAANGKTTVNEPYLSRNHTEKMLAACGVNIEQHGSTTTLMPPKSEEFAPPALIEVPGDISSAAYWLVLAAVTNGSNLRLKNVGVNETRTGIIDVLRKMGANIAFADECTSGGEPLADLIVTGNGALHGTTFGAEIVPRLIDEIPVIAAAALFADGDTVMNGVGELRVKETDRLAAIIDEFNKIAPASADATGDTLIIHGGKTLQNAAVKTYGDHRMAMALAVAAAAGAGAELDDAACVDISYPAFWETLTAVGR